uniref:Uncharacterized protein n=1 Tax=Anguilla anguilla TaxID=7936 RepID=A0A0E9TSX9_ANGAN
MYCHFGMAIHRKLLRNLKLYSSRLS